MKDMGKTNCINLVHSHLGPANRANNVPCENGVWAMDEDRDAGRETRSETIGARQSARDEIARDEDRQARRVPRRCDYLLVSIKTLILSCARA